MFKKLGIVIWKDCEYRNRLEIPKECPTMESIGYVEVLRDMVVVLHLKTPEGDPSLGIHTTIPKGCIKGIIWLERRNGKLSRNSRKTYR